MNENAKKWVAALRSGKYEQTTGRLHLKGDGYCCLGVACDLFAKENKIVISEDHWTGGVDIKYNGDSQLLPTPVRNWLGLASGRGNFDDDCLSCRNDRGASFKEIADIIESEPEGLFLK